MRSPPKSTSVTPGVEAIANVVLEGTAIETILPRPFADSTGIPGEGVSLLPSFHTRSLLFASQNLSVSTPHPVYLAGDRVAEIFAFPCGFDSLPYWLSKFSLLDRERFPIGFSPFPYWFFRTSDNIRQRDRPKLRYTQRLREFEPGCRHPLLERPDNPILDDRDSDRLSDPPDVVGVCSLSSIRGDRLPSQLH